MTEQRRLAAIVLADVAGYSRLISGILVGAMDGAPWLIAAFMVLLALTVAVLVMVVTVVRVLVVIR